MLGLYSPEQGRQILRERYPFIVKLVAGETEGGTISRRLASAVLSRVAEFGRSADFPVEFSLEEVGAALWRICINHPDGELEGLSRITLGWTVADAYQQGSWMDTRRAEEKEVT